MQIHKDDELLVEGDPDAVRSYSTNKNGISTGHVEIKLDNYEVSIPQEVIRNMAFQMLVEAEALHWELP